MESREKEFFDFVMQRQRIWHKRFILKERPPWSQDPVLSQYKILNVYRELDKGTKYIIDLLDKIEDRKMILLNVVFYRFFNRYGLYETIGLKPFDRFDDGIKSAILDRLNRINEKEPVFSDAYLIAGVKGEDKKISVLNSLSWLWENMDELLAKIDKAEKAEESFEVIKQIPLVGNFLAYEIWTDLTYFEFFNQGWTDDDFVNIGPGAEWGLEIIYGSLNKREGLNKIKHLHQIQKDYLNNSDWLHISYSKSFSNTPFLSLRNIEHSLCEFRKYWNLSHGKGKRRKFQPISHP